MFIGWLLFRLPSISIKVGIFYELKYLVQRVCKEIKKLTESYAFIQRILEVQARSRQTKSRRLHMNNEGDTNNEIA